MYSHVPLQYPMWGDTGELLSVKFCCFLWPLPTGDVRWQDGQIKEEEDTGENRPMTK